MLKNNNLSTLLISIFSLSLFFSSMSLSAQQFPEMVSPKGLVLEGKIDSRSTEWSADRKMLYTINWVRTEAIYQGSIPKEDLIPVLTEGGATADELLIVSHALNLNQGYDYLLALEPCEDCLTDKLAYRIKGSIPDFNHSAFITEKTKWKNQANISDPVNAESCKGGWSEVDQLLVRFGNIYITDLTQQLAYIDIETKTTEQPKTLNRLFTELWYDSAVFGDYAVSNSAMALTAAGGQVTTAYETRSSDISATEAEFNMEKKTTSSQAFIINTFYQPTARISFSFADMDLNNLPDSAEKLWRLLNLEASYDCNGISFDFDEITIEENPIGVVIAGSEIGITYTIENAAVNDDEDELTFDIYAFSDNEEESTEFKSGKIVLDYNEAAFGDNVVANSNVNVSITNNSYDLEVIDADNNTLNIQIGSALSSPSGSFTLITTTPTKLATVTFTVVECEEFSNIKFNFASMSGSSFYRDIDVPVTQAVAYTPVIAFDEEKAPVCGCDQPVITLFSPTQIVAGDNQVLTIIGENFGIYKRGMNPGMNGDGSSVLFTNGDYTTGNSSGTPQYVGAGKDDFMFGEILEWTDTKIKVRVPSSDWQGGVHGPAATGKIRVRRGCGKKKTSDDKLLIPYSLTTQRVANESFSRKLGLRNFNGSDGSQNGYVFQFNPEVDNSMRTAFDSALDTWCNATSIRFKKGEDNATNIDAQPGDGKNTVSVEQLANDDAEAGVPVSLLYFKIDCVNFDILRESGFIMTDIDVKIDPDFVINGTNDRKRRVLEHELGHAHMINHALCMTGSSCGPLMHPRGQSDIQGVDITGGQRIFGTSQFIANLNTCKLGGTPITVTPIGVGECGWINAVRDLKQLDVEVFPNPTTTSIVLHDLPQNAYIELHTVNGQLLRRIQATAINEEIDISAFSAGIYFLIVTTEDARGEYKIIKL